VDTTSSTPGDNGVYLKLEREDKLLEHRRYITKYGQDLPEIRNWKWEQPS